MASDQWAMRLTSAGRDLQEIYFEFRRPAGNVIDGSGHGESHTKGIPTFGESQTCHGQLRAIFSEPFSVDWSLLDPAAPTRWIGDRFLKSLYNQQSMSRTKASLLLALFAMLAFASVRCRALAIFPQLVSAPRSGSFLFCLPRLRERLLVTVVLTLLRLVYSHLVFLFSSLVGLCLISAHPPKPYPRRRWA